MLTRSSAARPVGVTSIITTRRSPSGASRRTQPRSTIALIEFDIVGRLTPWSEARSLSVRGRTLSIEQQAEMRRRRQLAGRAQLRGDRAHHQRNDFENLARGVARLAAGHGWRSELGELMVIVLSYHAALAWSNPAARRRERCVSLTVGKRLFTMQVPCDKGA